MPDLTTFKARGVRVRTVHLLPWNHNRVTPMLCGFRHPWRVGDSDIAVDHICPECLRVAGEQGLSLELVEGHVGGPDGTR